jgi:hypothetical protein
MGIMLPPNLPKPQRNFKQPTAQLNELSTLFQILKKQAQMSPVC